MLILLISLFTKLTFHYFPICLFIKCTVSYIIGICKKNELVVNVTTKTLALQQSNLNNSPCFAPSNIYKNKSTPNIK